MRRVFCIVVCLLWLGTNALSAGSRFSGVTELAGQPPIVLVDEETKPAPIVVSPQAQALEKRAAAELARYLEQISGAPFPVITAGNELPERAILIGQMAPQPRRDVSREGFVIRTDNGRLHVCGGTPHATMFAVFALLEEQLGCRWWSWNEEDVPKTSRLQVVAQNTHIEPAFQRHNVFNREAQSKTNSFAYKRRTISLTNFTGGHNLCPLLKSYAEERPDFLPMDKDGKRKFNNLHMNYTAEGMDVTLAGILKKHVAKRNGQLDGLIYFAGMGDWYGGMDQSPESRKIYKEETWVDPDGRRKPGYSATLLRMINSTAELLEKDYPGIQVGTFAYMSLEAPPAKTRPRSNVAIRLPRLRHDTVRSILESKKNQNFRRNLDRWAELAPGRLYIWEYGANFRNFLKPFPCLKSIAQNIKYYHKVGVAGVSIQGNYVSTGGDLAVLKNYVWSKLLWDPTRNADDLIREFCTGYYGPAADEMLAYVDLMESSVRGDPPISADEFDERWRWMTPELVRKARSLFAQALAKTRDDSAAPYFPRVKEAQASLEAWELWRPGPLEEDGERLIRADLGEDTFARANSLIEYCRNASPREWGNGPKYHMNFLVMHGGPLPHLKQGPLTVKVAPVQNGQLRSVLYNGKVAIDRSHVGLAVGSVYYELTSRQDNQVEMQADLGVSMWGGRRRNQTGYRTVTLDRDGTIRCTGAVERIGRRSGTNQATFVTTYKIATEPDEIQLEYAVGSDKTWHDVTVTRQSPTADVEDARHLRITRRDRGLVIDDRYHVAAEGVPVGRVEFDPKAMTLTVSVTLPETRIPTEGRAPYGKREIQVTRLSDAQ